MNEMLDFVKAMSHPDRLRIIGFLSQKPATRAEIAEAFGFTVRVAMNHLGFLEQVGAISKQGEAYMLSNDKLAALAREKLSQEKTSYTPGEDADEATQKILKAYLNPDGSIRQIPTHPKLQIILEYLVKAFEPNIDYTERQVNSILRRYNEDTAGLRRDLVDAGLLSREGDGSRYWRTIKS